MKTVFTNEECCHVWASQSQGEGRSGSISFNRGILYSYAAKIARIDGSVVLLADRKWSVTTSSHQGLAWSATSHMKHFHVSSVMCNHEENFRNYFAKIKGTHDSYFRARNRKESILRDNNAIHAEMLEYAKHFKVKYPDKAFGMTSIGAFVLSENGLGIQKERFDAERKEALALIEQAEIEWITGKSNTIAVNSNGKRFEFSCTRLRLSGNEIETSRHARVPQKEARVLYKAIKAGKPVHGMKVGMYTVNGCNGDLTVGCHTIPRHEVDRLAVSLNW